MESEVLEHENLAIASLAASLLYISTDAITLESNLALEQVLKGGHDRGHGELGLAGTIGSAEVAHENNRFGAVLKAVIDGGERAHNSLRVSDLTFLERDVEIDAHQDALVLD